MTPAIKSALTPIESLLVQIEYARDPDHALDMCGEFPALIRALTEVLGQEGASVGTVEEIDVDARTIAVWPAPVLTNCDSCRFDYRSDRYRLCDALTQGDHEQVAAIEGWIAPETAEDVARRCGLVRDPDAPDCWSVERTGAGRVWRTVAGEWDVWEHPLTYRHEVDALRAYAASVGK